jgi:predicted permease
MKLPAWLRRRTWERRMDSEMRFHLESQVREYLAQGLSMADAEERARREFGPLELAKDECRDRRALQWIDHVARDLHLAIRTLRKNPGFGLAVTLTLALGIGANTAIFSAVYAVLLKPLPYFQPDQLFMAEIEVPERTDEFGRLTGRIQDYLEWRDADTVFSSVAAMTPAEWNLTGTGEPEHVGGAIVSASFFSLLGVPIAHGRGFAPEEEQPGHDRVVVISDGLWRRRFAADPAITGKSIELDGRSHVVAGIAPAHLLVPTGRLLYLPFAPRIDVWKPQAPTKADLQGENWNQALLLRLKPGANPETGRQQLHALLNAPSKALPAGFKLIPRLTPIRDVYSGKVRLRLLLLLGASALLLLIACANIANLFLARVASRSAEFATRIALGAGRARILTQMLSESTLLALVGGALGAAIAYYGVWILIAYGPGDVTLLPQARLNLPVLLFAVATSLVTGFACGVFPAWQTYRQDAGVALQAGTRTSLGGKRAAGFRQALVGIEMALGTLLLASAALLLHSFVKVMGADRGYEVDRVLAVDLALSGRQYLKGSQRLAFYRNLTDNIRALPGVLASGAISRLPVAGDAESQVIFLETDTDFNGLVRKRPIAGFRQVTPGGFVAGGIVLLAGRFFTEQDRVTTAIVSDSLAKRLWPGEPPSNAVGRRIRQGDVTDQQGGLLTIVGVAGDVRAGAIERDLLPQIYRPYLPPRTDWRMAVLIRTSLEPASLAAAVRAEVRKMDPNIPIPAVRTMREIVSATVAERRFQMALTALFALVALLLGAVGIYGVVSYTVACRTREIGLRIALGAMRKDILGWVLSNGMRPVLIGLAAGLASAGTIAVVLRRLLFGIAPIDPLSLGAVTLVLTLTASLACYLPARRAARLDPMMAIRQE